MTPDEEQTELEWDKAVGQFQMAVGVVMEPLMKYGQQYYVGSAIEELKSLAIQLHWKLSGIDVPFGTDMPYHVNHDKLRG